MAISLKKTLSVSHFFDVTKIDSGTATSGTATTLTDTSKAWVINVHNGRIVSITEGTGSGQSRLIESNTSDTLTITRKWDINPSTDSKYVISGEETVTLNAVNNLKMNSKNNYTVFNRRVTKPRQLGEPSDIYPNRVIDLKYGRDTIIILGWLEDDSGESAWNKLWKLRAMKAIGGPLNELIIDNLTFNGDTQQAFLEEVIGEVPSTDSGELNINNQDNRARIRITLTFLIADER